MTTGHNIMWGRQQSLSTDSHQHHSFRCEHRRPGRAEPCSTSSPSRQLLTHSYIRTLICLPPYCGLSLPSVSPTYLVRIGHSLHHRRGLLRLPRPILGHQLRDDVRRLHQHSRPVLSLRLSDDWRRACADTYPGQELTRHPVIHGPLY